MQKGVVDDTIGALTTLFDFAIFLGIYHLLFVHYNNRKYYLQCVIFRWKSDIQEPSYHLFAWVLDKESFGL